MRLHGDTAVVAFRVMWDGSFRGMDISGPQRMTDVWVKRASRWQCVASQSTRVMQPQPQSIRQVPTKVVVVRPPEFIVRRREDGLELASSRSKVQGSSRNDAAAKMHKIRKNIHEVLRLLCLLAATRLLNPL